MPKIKFTARTVETLKPTGKTVDYFDQARGRGDGSLALRVTGTGVKSWYLFYKSPHTGKVARHLLGRFPAMGLAQARTAASALVGQIKESGHDPQQEKRRRRTAPTMTDLWELYQEQQDGRRRQKAPSTRREEERRWQKVIEPALGDYRVEDVTPADLADLLQGVAKTAPVSANRLHSLLQVLFKPALAQGWITTHPLQWVDKPSGAETPRARVLSDDEIKAVWPAFGQLRPNMERIFKLCLYTGQRSGEIMSMKWRDLDLEAGIWTVAATKTGGAHLVPLSRQVLALFAEQRAYQEAEAARRAKRYGVDDRVGDYVFPSHYNTTRGSETAGHVTSLKEARKRLHTLSKTSGWTTHDLRRTARTIMSRLAIAPHIRELVIGHSQGGIVRVYDRHDYVAEKAAALQKLADELDRIRGHEVPKARVIKMRRTA